MMKKQFSKQHLMLIEKLTEQDKQKLKKYLTAVFKKQEEKQQIEALNKDFTEFVKSSNFFNYMGDFYQKEQRVIEALKFYEKSLEKDPNHYWSNFHIANIYSQHIFNNNYSNLGISLPELIEKTINIYDDLIARNANDDRSLRALSNLYHYIGKYSRAVFIDRFLVEKGKFLSLDRCVYKPVTSIKEEGIKMNTFYERFALALENQKLVDRYTKEYAKKGDSIQEYLIAMTPRSGSSWLTELIAKTQLAGNPEEWFNQNNLDGILKNYQCKNLPDYLKCIKIAQSTPNNIFGTEASFYQLKLVLEGYPLQEIFNHTLKVIYLTRNDFIKQGISLYKAVISEYYHAHQNSAQAKFVSYDVSQIKQWILNILHQEYYWENMFKQEDIKPLRITYEELVADPKDCVKKIVTYVGAGDNFGLPAQTKHQKISDSSSKDFYDKFQENTNFIEACYQHRGTKKVLDISV